MEQAHGRAEWYKTFYGDQYRDSVRGLLTPERTADEVAFIRHVTGIEPPAAIADVACGEGRHARLFADQEFEVTGVDQIPEFIARAADGASVRAHFRVGDMREAFGGPYQLILLLYHSFGFFSDEENRMVFERWCERLGAESWCVIDVWNRDAIVRHLQPSREWQPSPDLRVREEYDFDPLTGRSDVYHAYIYADGRRYENDASFRLYTLTELRTLLEGSGLTVHSVYGSLQGEPHSLDARRMVVFAKRPESTMPARPDAEHS
jgi:D-alanine-D-alanine ligase